MKRLRLGLTISLLAVVLFMALFFAINTINDIQSAQADISHKTVTASVEYAQLTDAQVQYLPLVDTQVQRDITSQAFAPAN